ncbi:hypothetical protein ACLB2K_058917 [Fragaria x ananassa]
MASQSVLDWGLRLMWRVSPRLIGDCREVAISPRLIRDRGLWRGIPRLIGDCREVASQSALDWGLRLMWRVSPRLIGDCREVARSVLDWGPWLMARQSALDWGLSRSGQSVRAWLGTEAYVASQSALDWGLSRSGQSVRA